MKVTIENYKRVETKGAFQGFFTLVLNSPKLAIYGCKHFKNDSGDWFKLPQKEVQSDDETVEYYPILSFKDVEESAQIKSAVYEALQEVIHGNHQKARPTEIQGDTPSDWL